MENGREEPEEEHEADGDVGLGPPRCSQRRSDVCDLGPIKGEEAHTEPMRGTEQLVDDDVVGDDPADPAEVAEGGEEVAGDEVPGDRPGETDEEEAFAGHASTVTNTSIVGRVQSVEKGACDEIGGPDHGWGLDEEPTSDTTDGETDELCRHDDHPLVTEIVVLVVVDALNGDDVGSVGGISTDGGLR